MFLAQVQIIFHRPGLDGPVQVGWGGITGNGPNLIAAAGSKLFLFSPFEQSYRLDAEIEVGAAILSLAVGPVGPGLPGRGHIILGLDDRVLVYGAAAGALVKLGETAPEPGARFVDLAAANLNEGAGETVVAASAGREALYFYQAPAAAPRPQLPPRLPLLAIRVLPGPAQKVAVAARAEAAALYVAAAYQHNDRSGLLTLIFTEMGFMEGPALEDLGARALSLTAGDLRPAPGEELAWGGADGMFRVVEISGTLTTALVSDNLGGSLPALAAGRLPGEETSTLIAGTPGGYLFGYRAPVDSSSPDWAVNTGVPVHDLAVSAAGLVALGTADGSLQVWRLAPEGVLLHTVRAGETLTAIAAIYGTTVAALAALNNLSNPDLIFPGQVLVVRRA